MTLRIRNTETNVGLSTVFITYEVEYQSTSYTIMFSVCYHSDRFNYVIWKTHGAATVQEKTEFHPDVIRDLASMAESFVIEAVRKETAWP